MSKKLTTNQLLSRYGLTGGAIGLYFGLFFRPARQPSLLFVLGLAILITLVMTAIKVYRERPSLGGLLKSAALTFLKSILFLILLESRHPVYEYGGKFAVTIYMTVMGILGGLWYAYEKIRRARMS
jgi:hypothetical protein